MSKVYMALIGGWMILAAVALAPTLTVWTQIIKILLQLRA